MEQFPIIDFADFEKHPEELGREIIRACVDWGFMILTNYGISPEKVDRMFKMHKEFCALPESVKNECKINGRQIGYDLKASSEGMVFGGVRGDALNDGNIHSFWTTSMRVEIEDFKSQCHSVGTKLLQLFAAYFNLPTDYFSSAHDPTQGPGEVLRMLHYPKMDEQPDKSFPRLYSHTDWGSLTFVWPQSGGLEVETPSKKWMSVPLVPGGVVVNIGDAMAFWSGKTLKSTLHRINFENLPVTEERWSMAYFVNANSATAMEILKRDAEGSTTLVGKESTLTMGDYVAARLYMSQLEDAKSNWLGKQNIAQDVANRVMAAVQLVQDAGIANGSGIINLAQARA